MTQAVSGVNRAWLVFSGLAFLICGVLLLLRFGSSARPRAAMPATTAPATAAPVINEPLALGPGAAPPGATAPAPPPAIPAVGEAGLSRSDKSDRPKKAKSGKASARPQSGAHAPAVPETKPGPSRSIELNSGAIGGKSIRAPGPSDADIEAGTSRPREPAEAEVAVKRDPKPGRGKTKRHNPPPPTKDEGSEGSRPTAAAPPPSHAEKLTEGVLKVNAPTSMVVGESEHIRAVIGTKANADAVERDATEEIAPGPRVQIGREMMLSPLVRMELRSDVPGDFDITSFVPQPEQRITDSETTVWDWAVQPKHEGLRGLTLIVTDLKETSREPIRTKTYPVHIEVRVATFQRVHDLAVSISSVLSGLAGLIGAWMGLLRPVLQRRREGEAGAGGARPPQSGAPQPPGATGTTLRPGTDAPSASSPPHH